MKHFPQKEAYPWQNIAILPNYIPDLFCDMTNNLRMSSKQTIHAFLTEYTPLADGVKINKVSCPEPWIGGFVFAMILIHC